MAYRNLKCAAIYNNRLEQPSRTTASSHRKLLKAAIASSQGHGFRALARCRRLCSGFEFMLQSNLLTEEQIKSATEPAPHMNEQELVDEFRKIGTTVLPMASY
jgi:hypothetical protein